MRESVAALFHLTTEETRSATERQTGCAMQSLLDPQPSTSSAAEQPQENDVSDNLDMSEECKVCYTETIQIGLDCHHKFCGECLHRASIEGNGKRLRCPLCRFPVQYVYPLPGITYEEIPELQLRDRIDGEQLVVNISSDDEELPDIQPVAVAPAVNGQSRGNVLLARHGKLQEGLYDWSDEMSDYGITPEIRRGVSMDRRSRIVYSYSRALVTALRYRHKYMPATRCMTCFASSEEDMPKTLCCSRQMCFDCVGYMAEKQVGVCRRRSRSMEMPRCPACGFKPTTNKTKMPVSSKRGPRIGETNPTHVIVGYDNFVQAECSPERDVISAFEWDNVRFAQFFWDKATETWPELRERHPLLLRWISA